MPTKTQKNTDKKSQDKSRSKIQSLNLYLGTLFYFIWILVGLFFILFIIANIRQGIVQDLLKGKQTPPPQAQTQQPTEAPIPGIGKVNIECVQTALRVEAIQKIVQDGNTSKLTDDEKSKLEPCIVEKEQANPSTTDK